MIEISGFSFDVAELALIISFVLMFLVQLFYQILMARFSLSGKKRDKTVDYPSFSIIVPSRKDRKSVV